MEYIHVVDEYSIQNFYLKMKEKTVNKMCDPSSHLKFSFAMEEHSIGTDTPNIRRIKHFGPSSSLESKLMCYRKFIAHYLSLNYHFLIDLNLFTAYLREVERGGRDGAQCVATFYHNARDIGTNVKNLKEVKKVLHANNMQTRIFNISFWICV